jgi:hypothetical protein
VDRHIRNDPTLFLDTAVVSDEEEIDEEAIDDDENVPTEVAGTVEILFNDYNDDTAGDAQPPIENDPVQEPLHPITGIIMLPCDIITSPTTITS